MAFGYDPKDVSNCLEKGDYDAELVSAEVKQSKKGSPMLEVAWSVFANGERRRIRDYIVSPSTLFKLKNIAKAWRMEREFEERTFDLAEHIGKQIVVKLDVQSDANFGDRNSIVGYGEASGRSLPPRPAEPQPATVGDAHEGPAEHIPF